MRACTSRSAMLASRWLTVPLALLVVVGSSGVVDADQTTVERPVMYFGFDPNPSSLTLCGNGILRQPPSPNPLWSLDVSGLRSSGTTISGSDTDTAQTGFVCVTVQKQSAPVGEFAAMFRYQALPSDPPSQVHAHVTWFPGAEGRIIATEQ